MGYNCGIHCNWEITGQRSPPIFGESNIQVHFETRCRGRKKSDHPACHALWTVERSWVFDILGSFASWLHIKERGYKGARPGFGYNELASFWISTNDDHDFADVLEVLSEGEYIGELGSDERYEGSQSAASAAQSGFIWVKWVGLWTESDFSTKSQWREARSAPVAVTSSKWAGSFRRVSNGYHE